MFLGAIKQEKYLISKVDKSTNVEELQSRSRKLQDSLHFEQARCCSWHIARNQNCTQEY
jgi:hypothetical protein